VSSFSRRGSLTDLFAVKRRPLQCWVVYIRAAGHLIIVADPVTYQPTPITQDQKGDLFIIVRAAFHVEIKRSLVYLCTDLGCPSKVDLPKNSYTSFEHAT
jgi:hypothetical protein